MGLISAFELLFILSVIGLLIILGVRLRIGVGTALLLFVIGFLFLALVSLSKLTLTLFVAAVLLGVLCVRGMLRSHNKER